LTIFRKYLLIEDATGEKEHMISKSDLHQRAYYIYVEKRQGKNWLSGKEG
jgi:hypothetical protein